MQYKYSIRRLRRAKSQILQLVNGGGDIFKEIKKFRGQCTTISNCIDGEVGAQNIANHFQEINENLYSQHTLGEDFDKVKQNIQERVHHELQDDIYKVNTQSVKDALNKMKAMKSDAVFDFSSDCLMNASNKLIVPPNLNGFWLQAKFLLFYYCAH